MERSRGFGPGDFYEGEMAIDEIARAEIIVEIMHEIVLASHEVAAQEISRDPILEAMIATLLEKSHEWEPLRRSYLKKMIALRLATIHDIRQKATSEAEFFDKVKYEVSLELDELSNIQGLEDLTDPSWDFAFQDLLKLQTSED